jgi:hypothetical protein
LECSTPVFVSSRRDWTNARETENRVQWGAPQQRADFALVLSASRVTPWARRVLSGHATATINSSGALGNDGFGPKRLTEPSIASTLGTAATLRSTALLARDGGSWKKLTDRQGPWWRVHVRSTTRLPSEYPRRDRSRSQFSLNSWWSRGGPHSLSHTVGGVSERILIIFLVSSHKNHSRAKRYLILGSITS